MFLSMFLFFNRHLKLDGTKVFAFCVARAKVVYRHRSSTEGPALGRTVVRT